MVGAKPGIDILQTQKALHEESGADEEHQRHGHLARDERLLRALMQLTIARSSALAQRVVRVGACRVQRRADAERESGDDRQSERAQARTMLSIRN